jgi:hypothetical protein
MKVSETACLTLSWDKFYDEAYKQRELEFALARMFGKEFVVIRFTFSLNKASVVYRRILK